MLTCLGTVEGQGSAASDLEFGAQIRKVGAAVSSSYEGCREAADTHRGQGGWGVDTTEHLRLKEEFGRDCGKLQVKAAV